VIFDEGKAESKIKYKILHQNIEAEKVFEKKFARKMIVLLLLIYQGIDSEYPTKLQHLQ
jgi:hypothetical protein